MEEKPMSFEERRQKVREAMQQPFSQKYNNYYQKHFDPEYLIGGPTVESIGNIIYSNTYFKIYRLPKNWWEKLIQNKDDTFLALNFLESCAFISTQNTSTLFTD